MGYRLFAVGSFLPVALLAPQTPRIVVRLGPAPNQTLHMRTTEDVSMISEHEPPASGAPVAPQNIHLTLTTDMTFTVGSPNQEGHYDVRVVCDTVATTATVNGQPMTPAPMAPEPGLTFTLAYDDQGRVINPAAPPGPPRDAATELKRLLTSVMSTAAPLTLAIGETATVPDQLTLPVPSGGASDAMAMSGETRYTLTSVTVDGTDRIAHLTTKRTATFSRGSPAGGTEPLMAVEQRITSDGTIDVNIDRGIVLHTGQQTAIDGTVRMDARNGAAPRSTRTHGTVTIASDLLK